MSVDFLGLGSVITDVFTFLAPAQQQKLRETASELCQWFDNAAENGSLPFFADAKPGQRHKHTPFNPKSTANPEVVIANVRNYYFSTLNTHSQVKAVKAPELKVADEDLTTGVEVRSFILQGLICQKLIVTGMHGIMSIDKRFCEKVTATEIEFRGDANELESVGMHWMLRCPNLVTVKFTGQYPKLKTVDNCWMAECPRLANIDFYGITALEVVGDRWMFNSPKVDIDNVDFTPFADKLRTVGCCWLNGIEAKFDALTEVKEVKEDYQLKEELRKLLNKHDHRPMWALYVALKDTENKGVALPMAIVMDKKCGFERRADKEDERLGYSDGKRFTPGLRGVIGFTPLLMSIYLGRHDFAEALLAAGDPQAVGEDGIIPLHLAVLCNAECASELSGPDLAAVDNAGQTPLHSAASTGRAGTIKALLKVGANQAAVDNAGQTPLHCAAAYPNVSVDLIEAFRWNVAEFEANLTAVDNNGHTPLQVFEARSRSSNMAHPTYSKIRALLT